MIQTVIKRDGRIVGFNEEKIATAIRKAMLHTENGGRPGAGSPDHGSYFFQRRLANDCRSHPRRCRVGTDEQ